MGQEKKGYLGRMLYLEGVYSQWDSGMGYAEVMGVLGVVGSGATIDHTEGRAKG